MELRSDTAKVVEDAVVALAGMSRDRSMDKHILHTRDTSSSSASNLIIDNGNAYMAYQTYDNVMRQAQRFRREPPPLQSESTHSHTSLATTR